MKNTILLAAGIVLPLFIFSQIGFQKFYGRPSTFQEIRAIVPMDDGGFLLGGTNGDTNGNGDDFWIVKTDSLGNEEWSEFYGSSLNEELLFLNQTPDSGFLITGIKTFGIEEKHIYLLKIDSDYKFKWDKKLTKNDAWNCVNDIHIEENGDIFVASTIDCLYNHKSRLYKLNPSGNVEWAKYVSGIEKTVGISKTNDNQYFHYGYTGNLPDSKSFVHKFDKHGNSLWTKEVKYSGSESMKIRQAKYVPLSGHNILLSIANSYKSVMTEIDSDGEIIWQYVLPIYMSDPFDIVGVENDKYWIFTKKDIVEVNIGNTEVVIDQHDFPSISSLYCINDKFLIETGDIAMVGLKKNINNGFDGFIIKTDPGFNEILLKTLGDLGPRDWDQGFTVLPSNDNGYIMAGSGYFPGTENDLYIIKVDSVGTVEWELNDDSGGDGAIYDITHTADGALLFVGYAGPVNSRYLVLLKTDEDGNLLWKKQYLNNYLHDRFQCVPMPDSGAIVAYPGIKEGTIKSPRYMKIDINGDSVWTKQLSDTTTNKGFYKTIITEDNSLVSVGKGGTNDNGWVLKTDIDGNVIFDLEIETYSSSFFKFHDIAETDAGSFLIPTFGSQNDNTFDSLFLLELTTNGIIKQKYLLSNSYSNIKTPYIDRLSDGNYMLSFMANNNYFYTIYLNGDFEIFDIIEYNSTRNQYISDTRATYDNAMAIFGGAFNKNSMDFYLIKTWPNGAVKTIEISPLGQMSIYPNPAGKDLSISFESPYLGPVEISIISSSGQRLRYFKEEKSSSMFQGTYQLHGLPPGAYFVQLMANGRHITRAWIKQ